MSFILSHKNTMLNRIGTISLQSMTVLEHIPVSNYAYA